MKKQNNIVGRAKGTLTLLIVLLLAAGWLSTVFSVAFNREVNAQSALIKSADSLLEDKLYVRAARIYQEALNTYQTEYNDRIEIGLMDIYKEGGMTEQYYDLIRDRISSGKAEAGEYLELARFYVDSGSNLSALEYLEQGRSVFPDNTEITEMSESLRYETTRVATTFQTAGIPSDDYYIPVFNGEKWGYILESGRTALDFLYEEALRFSGDYAVVKLDGVYTLIDKNGYWNSVDKNDLDLVVSICGTRIVAVKDGVYGIYTNTFRKLSEEEYENVILNENGMYFVQKGGKWALLDENLEQVTDYIFSDVQSGSNGEAFYKGYAVVADENGYFLIRANGDACFQNGFSDAKGMESGLVAVSDENGRWGFCDESGKMIVDFQYEDARSFSGGLGAVRYAGKWGYINKYGTVVIDFEYEDAQPFCRKLACVWDSQGFLQLLKLRYYDVYMSN